MRMTSQKYHFLLWDWTILKNWGLAQALVHVLIKIKINDKTCDLFLDVLGVYVLDWGLESKMSKNNMKEVKKRDLTLTDKSKMNVST